jgi:hypothetical protein
MNYKYWCQFLEPDEFKNWEVEVLMSEAFIRPCGFLERDFDNWKEFINASFGWSNTKQGSQYWMDIFQRDEL